MTPQETQDPIDVALARLAPLVPRPARADAVRRRCREQLARQSVVSQRRKIVSGSWNAVLVTALLTALSAFYAAALLGTVLRIQRLLP